MNEADLRTQRTAMAHPSRSRLSERPNLTLVDGGRRRRTRAITPMRRFLTTLAAFVLLAVVLKFLPPMSKHSAVQASPSATPASVGDLHLSGVQISRAPDGAALYIDGIVTNSGSSRITGATAQVAFHDAHGRLIATVQAPLVGMSHGGTDVIRNEFARNPISPKEMRFFRIAVENVPSAWNQELPDLAIITVKAP